MASILVTGGCGYIGSHTIVELLRQGRFSVISADNLSNASEKTLDRIEALTGQRVRNYATDLSDREGVEEIFRNHPDIAGVIHFAALKSVGESVEKPLFYYENNILSLTRLLDACLRHGVKQFIFSSSCSLYGNIQQLPVNEDTPLSEPESPYAYTKLVGERILKDVVRIAPGLKAIALRYFNPVGADASGLIGEVPLGRPSNLVPAITQAASGWIPQMTVFGGDYDTRDGSCVRDYIHVSDIADAHLMALDYLMEGKNEAPFEVYNLGSGQGVTVLEAIHAFEAASGIRPPYVIGPRRAGDVVAIYSDSSRAKARLGWEARRDIAEMMASAWKWQQRLNEEREAARV
jgi:UDP-glucose 4-epimerase